MSTAAGGYLAEGQPPEEQAGSIFGATWPLLLMALACALPTPAANIFVGPISTEYGVTAATIGGMRGVGGGAALVVGFLAAPLLDRLPRRRTVCLGAGTALLASLLPLVGHISALILAFAALGAAIAIIMPALQAACGDQFSGSQAGRAASLVQASQTLSNVTAGPALALPALVGGWHGAYLAMGAAITVAMLVAVPRLSGDLPRRTTRAGYREAFALVARAPGAVLMLLSATARNCVIQAWLAFLAASLTDRFDASVSIVAAFWFLGGGALFLANVLTGRMFRDGEALSPHWWRSPWIVLQLSSLSMLLTAPLVYVAPTLSLAVVATIAFCVSCGTGIASLLSVLMERYSVLRGAVLSLNAAGQNVGIVFGTGIAGVGLAIGGYLGLALVLEVVSIFALGVLIIAMRQITVAART